MTRAAISKEAMIVRYGLSSKKKKKTPTPTTEAQDPLNQQASILEKRKKS